MASLEQWIKDFPVITRTYMAGALLTTAACALDLLSPFSLYFSLPMIVQRHQYWRLLTNFFFFGANFSLDFLFHMFFLVRYCRALEEGSFRGRTADFAFLILFGAVIMTCIAPLVSLHFLGSSLTFMMVYIWARRNPFGQYRRGAGAAVTSRLQRSSQSRDASAHPPPPPLCCRRALPPARMNFLGLFTFTAPYLPSASPHPSERRGVGLAKDSDRVTDSEPLSTVLYCYGVCVQLGVVVVQFLVGQQRPG
jgi:hypothetical protein